MFTVNKDEPQSDKQNVQSVSAMDCHGERIVYPPIEECSFVLVRPQSHALLGHLLNDLRSVSGLVTLYVAPLFLKYDQTTCLCADVANPTLLRLWAHFMTAGPAILILTAGLNAIDQTLDWAGRDPDPDRCAPQSIRYRYGIRDGSTGPEAFYHNILHKPNDLDEVAKQLPALMQSYIVGLSGAALARFSKTRQAGVEELFEEISTYLKIPSQAKVETLMRLKQLSMRCEMFLRPVQNEVIPAENRIDKIPEEILRWISSSELPGHIPEALTQFMTELFKNRLERLQEAE